ncbi:MAG: hypothetical protein PVH61_18105 [Candidatus Aminicenantes bacterium]|jgi:hypothetical protein
MKYELRSLSFGETLGQAFNLYFDNFVPLFLISLVSTLPLIVFTFIRIESGVYYSQSNRLIAVLTFLIIFVVVNTLCTALTIELISKRYLKQHHSMGTYVRNVLPFILPIIGLSILELFIIGLGLVAFLIPGIYLFLGLSVAVQVLIVERKRVMESIRRSFVLTQGRKLEILGYILIVLFVLKRILIDELLVPKVFYPLIGNMEAAYHTKLIMANAVFYLVQVLFNPISACLFILIYFNLRIKKEGFDLEHLVDQFGTSLPMTSDQ